MHAGGIVFIFLLLFLPSSLSATADSFCGAGEEGARVTLQCTANGIVRNSFVWQVKENEVYVNKTRCLVKGTCFSYDDSYSSYMSGNDCIINIVLNRNKTSWRCIWDDVNTKISPCITDVYIPPLKPVCDPPVFIASNTAVSVKCRTNRVYPSAQCRFIPYDGMDNLTVHEFPENTSTSPIDSQDYKTECTFYFFIPSSLTQPTVFRFAVGMFAVIKSTEVISDNITLALSYPESDHDCPNDYVQSSLVVTCTCKLTTTGVPPGIPYWTSSDSDKLSTIMINGSSQLQVAFSPSALNVTFYCRSKSAVLEQNSAIKFQPRFAYIPGAVSFTSTPSYVRFTVTTSVVLMCSVPINQVAPGVKFYFILPPDNNTLINSVQNDGFNYTAKLTYVLPRPGLYNIKCEVQNSRFPTLFSQGTLNVQAFGGAGSVIFDTSLYSVFDLCSGTIPIACTVEVSQVYPGTTRQLLINDELKYTQQSNESDAIYHLIYNLPVSSSGKLSLTCTVVNIQTQEVIGKESITVTVKDTDCGLNVLPIAVGAGVGGAALLVFVLIIGCICWKRRRNATRRPTENVSFTVGNSQVQVIVTRNVPAQKNGHYDAFSDPPPDYISPAEYIRIPSYSDSIRTVQTDISSIRNSNASNNEEQIYSDPDDYITLTQECAVGVEGSSIRLLCVVSSSVNNLITWQVDKGGRYADITTCHIHGACTSNSPDFYSFMTGSNCTIHVKSLSRNLSSWRCVWDDVHIGPPCNITVYVPPMKPVCDTPMFVNSNTAVSLTCRTAKTYPVAQCHFIQYTNTTALNNTRVVHKHSQSSINSLDYSTECTFVADLLPLSQPVSVTMGIGMISLPNTQLVYGGNTSLDFYFPVPYLDADCPHDYIMSGTTASCTCKLANAGSPPGQTYWFSTDFAKLVTFSKNNGASQLDFTFNSSVLDPIFYCYSMSTIGQPQNTLVYEPKFAFGPSQVFLEDLTSPDVQLTNSTSVLLRCNVSKDQVIPGVVFIYDVNGEQFVNWPHHSDGSFYTSNFICTPESPGPYNVSCRVLNLKFPKISAQSTIKIQVFGKFHFLVYNMTCYLSQSHYLSFFMSELCPPDFCLPGYCPPELCPPDFCLPGYCPPELCPPDFCLPCYCPPELCPPDFCLPGYCPPELCPPDFCLQGYCPPELCPPDFCLPGYCPPELCPHDFCLPGYCPPELCPPDFCPQEFDPPDFCPSDFCPPDFCLPDFCPPDFCPLTYV
ncbi:hypothetical protein Btru_029250 [Bulinus truncatus]|nr:hypothetical protein Btru_029250 [Bulinus truncatus]